MKEPVKITTANSTATDQNFIWLRAGMERGRRVLRFEDDSIGHTFALDESGMDALEATIKAWKAERKELAR